ncbi:MAG: HAD hydrolase-like protein [Anaerolineaceae bacterium]|nr:HAD hydrolase-like protein [Anaerolineaceae bacterium]
MKYKLVIFDFDGTLADSFSWLISVTDQVADRYKFKRLDKSQIETLRGYDVKKLIKDYHVPFWKIPQIGKHLRKLMSENIQFIRMFEGIPALLQGLADQGAVLAVLSSNSCQNIHQVLGPENAALIRYYECGVSIFGKPAKIRKLLKKSGIQAGEAILIGDEIRDLDAARAIPIASGAVSWGFARVEALQARSPSEFFTSVDDIAEKIGG